MSTTPSPSSPEHRGAWISINRPEWFADEAWLTFINGHASLTWHAKGSTPGEYSDVFVMIGETGEGPDDIPDAQRAELLAVLRAELLAVLREVGGREAMIQITNLDQ
jgi:hypothetical protein